MCGCSINIPMFLLLWIQQNTRYFNERYFETLRIFCYTENVLENVYHSSFHEVNVHHFYSVGQNIQIINGIEHSTNANFLRLESIWPSFS